MADSKQVVTQFITEIYTEGDQNEALTTCFTEFRIINSMRAPWPIINLYCALDNQVIIEKEIYGKSDITVKIWLTGEDGEKQEPPWEFTLLYLEANLDLPTKVEDNISDPRESFRRQVCFTCVAKPAFVAMTQFLNYIYEEPTSKTPIEIIKDLLDKVSITDRIISEEGKNENKIGQLIIPPMTVKSAVDFVNEKFGIYQGPLFRYANYSGQFLMWDLKKKFEEQKAEGFSKYHKLPSFSARQGLFDEINNTVSETDNNYLVYDDVKTLHYANAKVANFGYDNIHIIHPHEDIAVFQKKNVDDIVKDLGLWCDTEELKYHKDLKHRKLYYTDHKGFETDDGYSGEYSDYPLQSRMSDNMRDAASLRFFIYRNVKFNICQKVGEVLYLKPYSEHEYYQGSNYEGAYMVSESIITLTKNYMGQTFDNTFCHCRITGHRTVQTKD